MSLDIRKTKGIAEIILVLWYIGILDEFLFRVKLSAVIITITFWYILNEFLLWVEQVHQFVCVHFLGRREEDDLKEFTDALQELSEERTCSDKYLNIQNNSKGVKCSVYKDLYFQRYM